MTTVFHPSQYAIPGMMPMYPVVQPSTIRTTPDGGLQLVVATRPAGTPSSSFEVRIVSLGRKLIWRSTPGHFFEQIQDGEARTLLFIDGLAEPLPVGVYTLWLRGSSCDRSMVLEVPETPWNQQQPDECECSLRYIVSDHVDLNNGVTAVHVNYQAMLAAGPKEVLCKLVDMTTSTAVPELVSVVQNTAFGFTAQWITPAHNCRLLWTTWLP